MSSLFLLVREVLGRGVLIHSVVIAEGAPSNRSVHEYVASAPKISQNRDANTNFALNSSNLLTILSYFYRLWAIAWKTCLYINCFKKFLLIVGLINNCIVGAPQLGCVFYWTSTIHKRNGISTAITVPQSVLYSGLSKVMTIGQCSTQACQKS